MSKATDICNPRERDDMTSSEIEDRLLADQPLPHRRRADVRELLAGESAQAMREHRQADGMAEMARKAEQ